MYRTTAQPHNPVNLLLLFILSFILAQTACKKPIKEDDVVNEEIASSMAATSTCDYSQTICEDCLFQQQIEEDTSEYSTVLGDIYNNPYSISNMTAAFNYLYSQNIPSINTTHYYVRFKPATVYDLNTLDSLEFELYDHPLNRHVLQDGDYWPDAYQGLGQNEYPWLYTVIEINTPLPSNMQAEILEPLYIPDDNESLEDEAFYRTGNYDCDIQTYQTLREKRKNNPSLMPAPCQVVCDEECPTYPTCGGGGGGGGGGTPPSTMLKPSGMINFKTYTTIPTARVSASAPLKFVRIVGRRYFKIDKTYTDINGNFKFSKRFPKKVTIIVKFKASTGHGQHSVRSEFTGLSIWKAMFPLKKNIGTYKGNNLANLNYEFQKGATSTKRKTKLWVAAVSFNTAEETQLFLALNNMVSLPDDLRFYLYAKGTQADIPQFDMLRRSNAPLLNQNRWLLNELWNNGGPAVLAAAAAVVMAASPPIGIALALIAFHEIPQSPDIYINYRTSDINSITASKVSMSVGQQLGIAYLDKLTKESTISGGSALQEYTFSISYVKQRYPYDNYAPFGNGIDNNVDYHKGVVALWQAFSQHLGHTISNRLYGTGSSEFSLQGKNWVSTTGGSSHLKYLEEFNPGIGAPQDYFNWIPVGIINDLLDNTTDPSPVVDNVSGFTYNNIQIAFYNKPGTVSDFKNTLKAIQQNQANQIDALFTSYGY